MANNNSQTVNITLAKGLLKQVDAIAKDEFTSRSDIIRQALLSKIRSFKTHKLDEWGDPISENWQTLIDFREHGYPNGMPANEFIARIDALDGQDK